MKKLTPVLIVLFALAGVARAADAKKPSEDDVKKAQKVVEEKLADAKAQGARVTPITDEAVWKAMPGVIAFGVIFPQFPIGREPPAGFKAGNVVTVRDGKAEVIPDQKALEKFATAALAPVKSDDAAKEALKAYLRLDQELYQDGFYTFGILDKGITVEKAKDGRKASGQNAVEPKGGNKGEINASLTFDADGKLVKAEEKGQVFAGVRPICQATKLLDSDPIIRKMAEKDILVMGQSAKDYLDEQRAKASPELKKAIDRVWKQILDEGR